MGQLPDEIKLMSDLEFAGFDLEFIRNSVEKSSCDQSSALWYLLLEKRRNNCVSSTNTTQSQSRSSFSGSLTRTFEGIEGSKLSIDRRDYFKLKTTQEKIGILEEEEEELSLEDKDPVPDKLALKPRVLTQLKRLELSARKSVGIGHHSRWKSNNSEKDLTSDLPKEDE